MWAGIMSVKNNLMPRKPAVEFTIERKERFIEIYRKTGLLARTAELVGVTLGTVNEHRKFDEVFAEAVDNARECWIDEVLVQNAIKRAVEGVQEPMIGGKDRDQIVAYKTNYSDALHLALLKSKRPEFKDKGTPVDSGEAKNAGVLVVTTSPVHIDHWETLYSNMSDGSVVEEKERQQQERGEG